MKFQKKTATALVLAAVLAVGALPVSAAPVTSPAPAAAAPTAPASITTQFKTFTEADHGIVITEDAADPATLPDPIVIKFSGLVDISNSGGRLQTANGEEGEYSYATAPDGTKCLRLEYSKVKNWAFYRCMPAFIKSGMFSDEYKYVRLTYMTDDPIGGSVTLMNNGSGTKLTLSESSHVSAGAWVTTNAVNFSETDFAKRLNNGQHITVQFNTLNAETVYYIKELAFFATEKQAYDHYGDEPSMEGITCSTMTFGAEATGSTLDGDTYGVHTVSPEGTLDITYAEKTNIGGFKYMAKIKFKNTKAFDPKHVYMRVLYSADHPEGVESCSMYMNNDGTSERFRVCENVVDTNGKYVLSETVLIGTTYPERYSKGIHTSLLIGCPIEGGTYSIKAVYFFPDRASAEAFSVTDGEHKITVNGNDISKYQIVYDDNASPQIKAAVNALQKHVLTLTDISLPTVTDDTPESQYEILVGRSSRALSNKTVDTMKLEPNGYTVELAGNSIVISAVVPGVTDIAMNMFLDSYLYRGQSNIPKNITIGEGFGYTGSDKKLTAQNEWIVAPNVENPEHLTDSFDADSGYFTEENGENNWNIAGGVLTASAKTPALTYIHIYERNATVNAKMMYSGAGADAEFGLMQRYSSADAYVRAGYDVSSACWYIENREGIDFANYRVAEAPMALTEGTWYDVSFTVNGTTASLLVNGAVVCEAPVASVTHVTPGRLAVYAEDVTLSVDDYDAALLSAEGTAIKNVSHTKLPTDKYLEGGSAWEMNGGFLIYQHSNGTTYKSTDDGKTWQETEKWFATTNGYPNIIRLNNGDFLMIGSRSGYKISMTSSDEGKTWVDGGNITKTTFTGTDGKTASSGNMNDKLFQSATTNRIFYGQNYEGSQKPDGRQVFCEFYYSDDNGATWTKSETDSWNLGGTDENDVQWFGECKLLECADGTIRMYNSWNDYGCIVYSESTDGGKTFGPLVKMEEFICARSSMQFVLDTYAENDTTYYMVWVYSAPKSASSPMNRSRLALAKSTDGKEWTYLGDIWRWESNYTASGASINHIVDPFIKTTKDSVIIGTGLSEQMASGDDYPYHQGQRQHIWSIAKDTLPEGEKLNKFLDVTPASSYNDAVTFVSGEGLFNGTGDYTFSPEASMTRSMFVTVLGRLAKADVAAYATPTFNDVVAGQWYTSYVEWAAANGIVNGIGNGIYGINNNVTVEQACVILARYADYKVATAQTGKTAADFADGASVASWAAKEVDWAIANGVYAPEGALNPTSAASRATVATMFANYVKAFG